MSLRLPLAALFATVICTVSHAAIIQPDTVTASSFFLAPDDAFVVENTINGSGLQGAVGTLPAHSAYDEGNHWTTTGIGGPLVQWIQWGFNSPQTLATIHIWNHQSSAPIAANAGYDVGDFSLTFFNAALVQIGTYSETLAFDSNAAQSFNFGTLAGISFVRFDINSVQSSTNYTGLAEVAFTTGRSRPSTGVPDGGATAALLLLGLANIWSVRRFGRIG